MTWMTTGTPKSKKHQPSTPQAESETPQAPGAQATQEELDPSWRE